MVRLVKLQREQERWEFLVSSGAKGLALHKIIMATNERNSTRAHNRARIKERYANKKVLSESP